MSPPAAGWVHGNARREQAAPRRGHAPQGRSFGPRGGLARRDLLARAGGNAVGTAEEQERPVVPHDAQLADRADDDLVVAAVVDGVYVAVKPGEDVVEDNRAPVRDAPRDGVELRAGPGAERRRDMLLILGENVDGEASGPLDVRPARRAASLAHEHQRRVEGQRGEGLTGEPGRDSGFIGPGDDGHSGAEVAQNLAVGGRVDGGGPLVGRDHRPDPASWMATSMIMSSWPPTRPSSPHRARISWAGTL